jgi:transposase
VWADEGRDTAAAERFYDALGAARSHQLRAVSMDMGNAYPKVTRHRAPQAVICWDPYHIVAMATRELDVVRRGQWNHLRDTTDAATAKRFKGARWALLKRPEDLSDRQADQLAALRRAGGQVWRAYRLKEALRAIFAGDPVTGRGRGAVGPLVFVGAALPHRRVRHARPHHPRTS